MIRLIIRGQRVVRMEGLEPASNYMIGAPVNVSNVTRISFPAPIKEIEIVVEPASVEGEK